MYPLFIILGIIGGVILLMVIVFIIFYKDIMSFFFPDRWVKVFILELDNNIRSKLIKKNDTLTFRFNDATYYLYEKRDSNDRHKTTIYRNGRLPAMMYNEGNQFPLDLRPDKINIESAINTELEKTQIAALFEDDISGAEEFLKKYGIFIIIGIFLLVLYIAFRPQPQQVTQTAPLIFWYLNKKGAASL